MTLLLILTGITLVTGTAILARPEQRPRSSHTIRHRRLAMLAAGLSGCVLGLFILAVCERCGTHRSRRRIAEELPGTGTVEVPPYTVPGAVPPSAADTRAVIRHAAQTPHTDLTTGSAPRISELACRGVDGRGWLLEVVHRQSDRNRPVTHPERAGR